MTPPPLLRFFLLAFVLPWARAAATCFFPNGAISPSDIPCSPNAAESVCCAPSQQCSDNKFCIDPLSPSSVWNRGSCTDKSWGPACQQFCTDVSTSTGSALTPCSNSGHWACGTNASACKVAASVLTLGVPLPTALAGGTAFALAGMAEAATATAGTACPTGAALFGVTTTTVTVAGCPTGVSSLLGNASPTTITTTTASLAAGVPASALSTAQKVGLGVGVVLGILLMAGAVGAAYFFARRRSREAGWKMCRGLGAGFGFGLGFERVVEDDDKSLGRTEMRARGARTGSSCWDDEKICVEEPEPAIVPWAAVELPAEGRRSRRMSRM